MSRLVDYFVVLAYDFERKDHGKIIQKFPLSDWADSKFIEGIELFCQPKGWHLTKISRNFDENVLTPTTGNTIKLNDINAQSLQNHTQVIKDEPTFFVSVLTDINGDRHYCACLTFRETYYELLSTKDDAKTREDVYGKDKPFQPLPQQNSHDFEYFDLPTNNFFNARNRIDKRVSTPNGSFNVIGNNNFNNYVGDELNRSYKNIGNCFANPLIGKEGLSSYNEAYDRTPFYQNHDGCSTITPNHFTSSLSSYGLNGNNRNPSYSAPKCLVIISRHPFFDLFRKFLGKIYTTYLDHQNSPPDNMILESLIANLLSINVSLPLFQFSAEQLYNPFNESNITSIPSSVSISLDEKSLKSNLNNLLHHKKDYLQLSNQFPITDSCVATFFSQLGIHNSLMLVMACLMDHKLLFHSKSYQRLTDSCHALTSLLFPLKYLNVYIPILPFTLLEILYAPTPFIIGLHADILEENNEMNDIITCDLDIGLVTIPPEMNIPIIPAPIYQKMRTALEKIINPELEYADNAFQKLSCGLTPPNLLDKEIRSIFLHMYARLFKGYRSCLVLSRIIPKPYITFDKNKFLKYHGLVGNAFMNRLFESMAFQTFVNERGNPYRSYDIFDQIYHHRQIQNVMSQFESTLAPYILNKETNLLNSIVLPDPISTHTIPKSNCIHGGKQLSFTQHARQSNMLERRPFPYLNQTVVIEFLDMISKKNKCENPSRNPDHNLMIENSLTVIESTTCVNLKTSTTTKLNKRSQTFLQCLENILKGDLHEAKKTFPSALRLLRSDLDMRTLFCEKLTEFSSAITTQQAKNGANICNKTILDSTQFDMIIQFINALLECETVNDENGLAASILPLSSIFCQKLATGAIQFIYTVIQNHLVWTNMAFWETAFYIDVQTQLLRHYQQTNPELTLKANGHLLTLAANLLQNFSELPSDSVKDMIETEESIIYSMVIHYVNQIIYLRIPLESIDESSLLFYKTKENEKISEINTNHYLMPNLSSCGKSHSYKNSTTDSKSPSVNRLSIKSSSIYSNNKRVFANAVHKPKIALTKMAKSVLHSTTLSRRHFSITSSNINNNNSKAISSEPFHNNINTTNAAYPTLNNNNNNQRLRNGSYIFDDNVDFSDSDNNDMNDLENDNGSLNDGDDGSSSPTSNFDEESGFEDVIHVTTTAIVANNINTEDNIINHSSSIQENTSRINPGGYNCIQKNETCPLTQQNEVILTTEAKGKDEQEIIMLEELIDSPMNQHVLQLIKDVEKFIHRFVDKVCGDLGVTAHHMNNLYQMIPGLISMHVEMLENVRSQITSIPPSLLINHILPPLLPFETINKECKEGIRVYLFFGPMLTPYTLAQKHKNMVFLNNSSYFPIKPVVSINNRTKTSPNNTHLILNQKFVSSHTQSSASSPHTKQQSNILIRNDDICQLVPAHGNLYVTNYRIIFRGVPIHEHAHESDILMSIPLWALSKATMIDIKRSSSSNFAKIFQYQAGKNSTSINGETQNCTTIFCNSHNTSDKNLNKFTTALVLRSLSFQIMHLVLDTNFVTNTISHYKCTQHICSYFNNVVYHRNLSKPYPLHVLQNAFNSTKTLNTANAMPTETNITVETNKGYEKKKSHTFKMLKKTTSNILHVSSALTKKANQSDLETKDVTTTNGQISFKSNKKSLHSYTEQDYICIRDFIRTKLISGVNEWNNIKTNKMGLLNAETSETEILSSFYTLIKCNQKYKIPSYPPYFVIPSNLSESQDDILKIGKGYKNNRLPIITWKHPKSKVLLLRSSSLSSHQLIKMFKTGKYMPTTLKNASKNVKIHANQLLNNLQINNLPTLSDTRRYFMNLSQTVRQERNKFGDNYTPPQPFSQNVVTEITKEMRMLINRAHEGEDTSQLSNIPDAKKYMRHSPIPNPQQNLQNINGDTPFKNQDLPDICFIGEKQNFKMFATMFKDCDNFQFIPFTYDGVDDVRKSYKKLFSLVTNADYLMDTCESLDKEQGSPISAAENPISSVKSLDFSDLSSKSSPLLETNNVFLIGKNDTISPSDKPFNNTNPEKLQIKSLGYLSMLEKCGWLQQIYNVLRISSIIVEIMDSFNSSVIVGLENGCDITIQIVSIVQLLLDPYYRTIDGLKTLIYKEWFCHGHKFGERNRYGNNNNMMILSQIKSTLANKTNSFNNTAALNEKSLGNSEFQNDVNLRPTIGTMNENDGENVKTSSEATSCYIPIFIQFLDMVYQIHRKFSSYFEFNGFFLEYLAFHSISGRYMDFFFNCHAERNIFEDTFQNFGRDNPDSKLSTNVPVTIWESIEEIEKNKKFTFLNPLYEKKAINEISLPPLRIFCTSLTDLCVWPYYLRMSHTLYDGNCFGAYDQNFCHESTNDYNGVAPITEPEKNVVMHYNARCLKSNSFPLYWSHELSYIHLVENYDQKAIHNVAETSIMYNFMEETGVDIKDSSEFGKRIMIALVLELMRGNLKYPVGGKIMDFIQNLDQKRFHQNTLEHTITTLSSNHNFQKVDCSFTHAFNCDFCTHVIIREHIVYTCSKCNYLCHDECLHYVIKSQCSLKLNRENLVNGNPSKGLIIKTDDKPASDEKIWLKKTDSPLYDENKSKPKIWNTQNNEMDITKSFDDFNDVLLQHFELESHNKASSTINVSNDSNQNFNENSQFKKMDKFGNPNLSQRNLAYNFENFNNNNNNNNNNNIYDERDITSDSQNILTKKHNTSLISIYENISKNDKKITYCNLTNTNPKRSQQNINKSSSISEKPDKSDSSSINTSGISTLSTQTGIPSIPNDNFSSTYVSSLTNGKNISNKNGLKLTLGKDLTLCEKSVQQSIYYQGFLYKKSGSLIKEWKPRWVVLDAVRHELRYYENENARICRGVIELSHPYTVFPCANAPLTSEKLDENQPHQYFEIHVEKRTYIFAAFDSHSAKEWISRLRHLSTIN